VFSCSFCNRFFLFFSFSFCGKTCFAKKYIWNSFENFCRFEVHSNRFVLIFAYQRNFCTANLFGVFIKIMKTFWNWKNCLFILYHLIKVTAQKLFSNRTCMDASIYFLIVSRLSMVMRFVPCNGTVGSRFLTYPIASYFTWYGCNFRSWKRLQYTHNAISRN